MKYDAEDLSKSVRKKQDRTSLSKFYMKCLGIFCINEQNKKYFISHWKYAISWSRKMKLRDLPLKTYEM